MSIINSVIKGKQPVIDTLNVTPTTSAQTITAPSGTDGYSPVNVSAVTSSIDANIVAGNIKKDVQILGVTGNYEGTTPTGTLNISANDTYDVTNYASAVVNVPTTAPAYYVEKTKDANNVLVGGSTVINLSGVEDVSDFQLAYAYYHNTNITGAVDLSSLTSISGKSALQNSFSNCTNITSVDLSGLTTISGITSLNSAFISCTGITNINMSSLTTLSGSNSMAYCFQYCSGITSVSLPALTTITGNSPLSNCFAGCSSLATVNIPNLEYVFSSSNCFANCFSQTGLTSISLPKLVFGEGNAWGTNICYQCTSLISFSMPKLLTAGNETSTRGIANICSGASSLSSVDFSNLYQIISQQALQYAFQNTVLTTLSFPSLAETGTYTNQFDNMLSGVTGCTVHFPSNMQSVIGSWTSVTNGFGGTNTTVLFDIISQITVNSTIYNQFSPLTTDNYRAWIDPTSNITIGSTVYTIAGISIGTKSTNERIIMYHWKNGNTNRYTTTATPTTSDRAYDYANITMSSSAISATDVDVIYTALGTPVVNDTVYSDEGITSVGTITAVA